MDLGAVIARSSVCGEVHSIGLYTLFEERMNNGSSDLISEALEVLKALRALKG